MKPFINFNRRFPVWPQGIVCFAVVSIIACSTAALAHLGERIYPIFEITDDMLELIDLEDEGVEEWEELWEPSLTTLDFTREVFDGRTSTREIVSYDPSDLDFRMWVGWNDTHNRLYVSGQFADDIYLREGTIRHAPDYMNFYVDGDHTGGNYHFLTGDRYRDNYAQAQAYWVPYPWDRELPIEMGHNSFGERYQSAWAGELPYAYGRNGAEGENPVVWNVEFYITPFALLDYDPEDSLVSELERGKVIGFYIKVGDGDMEDEAGNSYNLDEGVGNPNWNADVFVDGVLLGLGEFVEGSAVQPSSWGLIKASLSY